MQEKLQTLLKVLTKLKNPWVFFGEYFNTLKSPLIQFNFWSGVSLLSRVKTSDTFIITEIFLHEEYTLPPLQKTPTVLDIGANIGAFSIFVKQKYPLAQIIAIEPERSNVALIKKNIQLNKMKNIQVVEAAVTRKRKKIQLYSPDEKEHACYTTLNKKGAKLHSEVRGESFSNILKKKKNFSLVKIDCEGAEYDFLPYTSKKDLSKINHLLIEYHNIDKRRNHKTLKQFLEDNNFEVLIKKVYPKSGLLIAKNLLLNKVIS